MTNHDNNALPELRWTHHVHRGSESLPCYCGAASDHAIGHEVSGDLDSAALEVARRFAPATEPQRIAQLQVAIIELCRCAEEAGYAKGVREVGAEAQANVQALEARLVALEKDAARYRWIKANVSETLTASSTVGEYPHSEHKTQYVLPKLIAWAEFCGQITLDEAIDAALLESKP